MKNVIEIKKDIEKMERSIFSLENQLESGDVTYEWKKMNDELKDLKTRVELLKKEVAVAQSQCRRLDNNLVFSFFEP